jgi:CheY-like chemotaxis protein
MNTLTTGAAPPLVDRLRPRGLRPRAGRTPLELLLAQLAGIDGAVRRASQTPFATLVPPFTREQQLDRSRWDDAVARELTALRTYAQRELETPVAGCEPRAVVAHRSDWVRDRIAEALGRHEIRVVARLDNGADAVGVTVAEQPDLLIVEDRLPSFSGLQVMHRVRELSAALVVVQVLGTEQIGEFLDAGADAVSIFGTPPTDVARQAAELVTPSATTTAHGGALPAPRGASA